MWVFHLFLGKKESYYFFEFALIFLATTRLPLRIQILSVKERIPLKQTVYKTGPSTPTTDLLLEKLTPEFALETLGSM